MNRRTLFQRPLQLTLLVLLAAFTVAMYFNNMLLFWVQLAITLGCAVAVILNNMSATRRIHRLLQSVTHSLKAADADLIKDYPMPVMVANRVGEVVWYNDCFRKSVIAEEDIYGTGAKDIVPTLKFLAEDFVSGTAEIEYNSKKYTVYGVKAESNEETKYIFYFAENTELKKYYNEYFETRPSIVIFVVDNYEELLQNATDSEKSQIIGEIEYMVEKFVTQTNGFVKKYERDRMVAVIEERYIKKIIENKFDILDKVRSIVSGDRIQATLSIGVGRGAATLEESEHLARQALDMCLGRGGDQAAVKTATGFEFYGGVSKAVEKRTKVKARIIASALTELINAADNVVVMGHSFGDLDSVGSAVGIAQAARHLGKMSYVAVNESRCLALPLINMLRERGVNDLFYPPADVLQVITKKTLLIVVDTHIKHFVESTDIYNSCRTVVVIDHHRKSVDHIDNAVIFYHEPYASSASEMVSELVQYMHDRKTIGKNEAESLLAGIMLDTKNFVMKTGVRTFEAAAYLRRLGADTVESRKLFSNSMESYQKKTRLVSSAEVYRRCAVAVSEETGVEDDLRIVAAQAADELLGINDVDASFVLFDTGAKVSVSGRSMGAVNVQVILEQMGGGGHLTMAGAQIESESVDDVKQQLLEAIDKYYEDTKPA